MRGAAAGHLVVGTRVTANRRRAATSAGGSQNATTSGRDSHLLQQVRHRAHGRRPMRAGVRLAGEHAAALARKTWDQAPDWHYQHRDRALVHRRQAGIHPDRGEAARRLLRYVIDLLLLPPVRPPLDHRCGQRAPWPES